jgi:transposase
MEELYNLGIVALREADGTIPKSVELRLDLLRIAVLKDGTEVGVHLESQTKDDVYMNFRMWGYKWFAATYLKLPIFQAVLHLGAKPSKMTNETPKLLATPPFEVYSLQGQSYRKFIDSPDPRRVVLTILTDFEGMNPRKMIDLIINRLQIACESTGELKKYLEYLILLSNLRNLDEITSRKVIAMPLDLNIEESYVYQLAKKKYEALLIKAERAKKAADKKRLAAERERRIAEQQKLAAERERQIAEQQKLAAERERQIAEQQKLAAQRERQIAEEQKLAAERERQIAERERHETMVKLFQSGKFSVAEIAALYNLEAAEVERLIKNSNL